MDGRIEENTFYFSVLKKVNVTGEGWELNRHVLSNLLTLAKRVIIVTKYNMLERCCQYQDYPSSSYLFKF